MNVLFDMHSYPDELPVSTYSVRDWEREVNHGERKIRDGKGNTSNK